LHKELTILTQINTKLGKFFNPSISSSSASSEEMSGATGNSE